MTTENSRADALTPDEREVLEHAAGFLHTKAATALRKILAAPPALHPAAAPIPYDGLTEEFVDEVARLCNDAPGSRNAVYAALVNCNAVIVPQGKTAPSPADERAAFEAWYRREFSTSYPGRDMDRVLECTENDPYNPWRRYWVGWQARAASAKETAAEGAAFQARVQPWMLACFGAEISADVLERNHRFFEEAGELVQACGMTREEAHALVDYTWSRPVGEPPQEVGGVMVTLAALCLANGLDMHAAGETELARINVPETIAKIRAKQAAKPKHSPLPEAIRSPAMAAEAVARVEETSVGPKLFVNDVLVYWWLGCMHDEKVKEIARKINAAAQPAQASYDGNHVENHCPECSQYESECECAQADARVGLTDERILEEFVRKGFNVYDLDGVAIRPLGRASIEVVRALLQGANHAE
ncbi:MULTISPECIES: hypothetical protein [Burkholderia]|uniref:hypothetical protein n=1 Tax=Burkholderia TaxID=32008 RepID=UPI000A54FE8A|nr:MULTISPECIES: hypothetical protein [Burkholderia]